MRKRHEYKPSVCWACDWWKWYVVHRACWQKNNNEQCKQSIMFTPFHCQYLSGNVSNSTGQVANNECQKRNCSLFKVQRHQHSVATRHKWYKCFAHQDHVMQVGYQSAEEVNVISTVTDEWLFGHCMLIRSCHFKPSVYSNYFWAKHLSQGWSWHTIQH